MRILIIYYSFTGNTRKVSELLAAKLGADTAEFTCKTYASGILGGLRQAWDIFTGGMPRIEVPTDPGRYDLVIAAAPVWGGRPAPPLRTFVAEYLHGCRAVALFLTCSGTSKRFSGEKALQEIAIAAGAAHPPVATRLFKEAVITSDDIDTAVAEFAETLDKLSPKIPTMVG